MHVDQYIPVLNQHAEFRYLYLRIEMMHAGAAIVPPSVPGANQQITLKDALPQRPSAARADSIERVDLAVQIAKGEVFFTNRYLGG